MAWGPSGLKAASANEKPIPPDSDIVMLVKLLECIPLHNAEGPPDWNDMIQEVTWRKRNGNDHFKRQEFHKALKCYGEGVELFSNNGFEPPEHIEEADRPRAKAAAMALVTDCGANLAAVHLELGNAVAAREAATTVLDFCPEHVKGLYRMARATLQLDDFTECEAAIEKGLKLEKDNAALLKVQAELRHKQQRYAAKSKKVAAAAARVFESLDYPEPKKPEPPPPEDTWAMWAWKQFKEWFDWRIAVAMLASSLLMAVLLCLLPKRFWPPVMIMFVCAVPACIGVAQGLSGDDKKEDGAKDKKQK